jgi:PAS domain S-box-containing protein
MNMRLFGYRAHAIAGKDRMKEPEVTRLDPSPSEVRRTHGPSPLLIGSPYSVDPTDEEDLQPKTTTTETAEALRAGEARFSAVFHASPFWISITRRSDGHLLDVNPAFLNRLGFEREEVIGRTSTELNIWARPEDRDRMIQALRSRGQVREFETTARTKTGQFLQVLISLESIELLGETVILSLIQDVTEKAVAERALRESEERNRALAETAFDWIWEVDAQGRYTFASPKVFDLLGYTPEEVLGRTPFDLMPKEEAVRVGAEFAGITAERRSFGFLENLNVHKDGRLVVLETSGVPILGPDGELRGYRGYDRDITSRKAAEKETQRRFKETAAVFQVALIGAAGRPFDETVSHAVEAISDLWPGSHVAFLFVEDEGEWLRLHPASHGFSTELFPSGRIPLSMGITGWVARHRQPLRLDEAARDPRYVAAASGTQPEMAVPLVVGDRLIGVVNIESPDPKAYTDNDLTVLIGLASQLATIIEKSRLDAELAAYAANLEVRVRERTAEVRGQHARTQAILDALGEGVIVTDVTGTVEYLNPAAGALTGFSPEEALGGNPRLWKSDLTPHSEYEKMWETILQGNTWRGEIVNRRRDGSFYDAALTIAPIPSPDDSAKIAGFAGVQRDISIQKKAEADIRHALDQEKELGDLKSRFISMTSHEFRTPLSTIFSSTELLQHYGANWPEQKRFVHLHRIQFAVQHMIRLMEDVLQLGRVEAGRVTCDPVPLDLVQFCNDLIEEMQMNAGPKYDLRLICDSPSVQGSLDEKLLRQILSNLLSNAIKYSPAGGPVHLRIIKEHGCVTFQVRDEGIGIPEGEGSKLYEAFHRAANVGNIPGTGLGLAIAKKSVDIHQGTISVDSLPGHGTTFTVKLPFGSGD